MIINDRIFVSDEIGILHLNIDDDGTVNIYSDPTKLADCILSFSSLDSDLTVNILAHESPIGHNWWQYYNKFFIKKEGMVNHPGLKLKIYTSDFKTLILEKFYHFDKKYKCMELKSNQHSYGYQPYYTFFNDPFFLKNFTIKSKDVVYDLGANIGAFSLACANYDVKQIYAFEPTLETFEYLKYNTEKYGKNTTCFRKAISNEFKPLHFGGVSKSCSVGYKILSDTNTVHCETVDGINLEKFVYINNLELPTYFKIDIEGGEYDFFESTSDEFFKNTHSIFFEFHYNTTVNLQKIINRFVNLQYKLIHECSLNDQMGTIYLVK